MMVGLTDRTRITSLRSLLVVFSVTLLSLPPPSTTTTTTLTTPQSISTYAPQLHYFNQKKLQCKACLTVSRPIIVLFLSSRNELTDSQWGKHIQMGYAPCAVLQPRLLGIKRCRRKAEHGNDSADCNSYPTCSASRGKGIYIFPAVPGRVLTDCLCPRLPPVVSVPEY